MSFLARLLGRPDQDLAPAAAPNPPPNSVVVPGDLADALTAGGRPLAEAVEEALREHVARRDRPLAREPSGEDDRVPFWLGRDDESRSMDEKLRGRLERRRAAEAAGPSAGDGEGAPGSRSGGQTTET